MKKELQDKLFEKYSALFKQRTYPKSDSCMYWGICVGDGWYNLLDELCAKIVAIDPEAEAEQVKEKFGGLRFYIATSNKEVMSLVGDAEGASYYICEDCGEKGMLRKGGWVRSLCDKHSNGAPTFPLCEHNIPAFLLCNACGDKSK